jgi:hypothetical protein
MKRLLTVVPLVLLAAVVAVMVSRRSPTDGSFALGPKDGFDLEPTDRDRVEVGSVAPDFSLLALSGDTVTLSESWGREVVVLVFYRGHW